jgi:hypothetical protein
MSARTFVAGLLSSVVLALGPGGIASADAYTPEQWDFINSFAGYFPPTATPPEILSLPTGTCQMMRGGEKAIDMYHDLQSVLGPISQREAASVIAKSGYAQCPDMVGYVG